MKTTSLALFIALSTTACATEDASDAGDATVPDGAVPDGARDSAVPGDARPDSGPNPDGSTDPDSGPPPDPTPVLRNFRIADDGKDRVVFDASGDVSGLTTPDGFVIPGKTITSVTVDADGLGGYFTVSAEFDFWDNHTIRLGEIEDPDAQAVLHNFTMEYIQNEIPEPAASTFRYVTPSASGGGAGETEADAWTWDEATANASAGMTVWVKAGAYDRVGAPVELSADGTRTDPIKWIGYRSSTGDIAANYIDSYDDIKNNWDPSEMPTLVGPAVPGNGDYGFLVNGASWNIVRNIQTERFGYSLRTTGGSSTRSWDGLVIERFNSRENVSPTVRNMSGINIRTTMADTHHFIRIRDSVFLNHTMAAISFYRDDKDSGSIGHFLIDNVKTFSDYKTSPEREDYHIAVSGHFGIVRNCYSEQLSDDPSAGSVHGIGVRGGSGSGQSTYILFDGNQVYNVQEGLYVRNSGSNRHVFKRNRVGLGSLPNLSQGDTGGIVMAWGGCDYNLFEMNTIDSMSTGIWIRHNSEDDTPAFGRNNVVRNNVFIGNQGINSNAFINCSSTSGGAPMGDNSGNKIYNNTIVAYRFFYDLTTDGADVTLGLEVRNNIIEDLTWNLGHFGSYDAFTFNDNLIHDVVGDMNDFIGTDGNFDANPLLGADYLPAAPFSAIQVSQAPGVYDDRSGREREDPTTVGAMMSTEE